MLKIENINKIRGQHLFSYGLPKTTGWVVRDWEAVGDTYIFELACSNGRFRQAEIQLRRESKWNNSSNKKVYELWAWNLENNRPEQLWCNMYEMRSTNEFAIKLGIILDKIIPN